MDPGPLQITLYREFASKTEAAEFNGSAFLICAQYVAALKTKGWKLSKRLNIHLHRTVGETVWVKGGIVSLDAPFDHGFFLTATPQERRWIILETVHQATLRCSAVLNWPERAIEEAREKVLDGSVELAQESKLVRSPDRLHYASVVRLLSEKQTVMKVRFYDGKKVLLREIELIRTFQDPLFYFEITKRKEWFTNKDFGIGTNTGELWITASTHAQFSTVHLNPIATPEEELKGLLRKSTYREFNSEAERIAWANG